MQVSEVLERKGKNVVTLRPDIAVQSAVAELAKHNIGAVILSGNGRRVEGIVTERDIVRGLAKHGAAYLEKKLADVTLHDVYSCKPSDDLYTVMVFMRRRRIRHMPVTVNGMLCGMISIVDVLREYLAKANIK